MQISKIIHCTFISFNKATMSYKSRFVCLKFSLVLIFLLLLQPVFPQYKWADLDKKLGEEQKNLGNNVVMLLWNKDSLLYKKELGTFNSKTQAPIASCSKWLTAALVMIYVDEGKLSLDDKIGRWLPEFDRYGKSYITVRHCLTHMTGIRDEKVSLKSIVERRKYSSLQEEVDAFAAREIRVNAGEDFWYGSIGLNIAGRIIEVISKRNFDAIIKQKLFNPLEMRKTTFTNLYGSVNPSGGAQSTADDYMNFLVMLLNKGKFKGKQVLSEKSVDALMQVQTKPSFIKYAPENAKNLNYALGSWAIEEKNGNATCAASPGLFGTWPMVDLCRGYAYLIFTRNLLIEERTNTNLELKAVVDKQTGDNCK